MSNTQSSFDFDQNRLLALQINLCSRIDDLFAELGVSAVRSHKMYSGPCPIHCGDNAGALNLYFDGDSVPGYWRCQTRHCERTFRKTIIGFVRGVLSNREHGWIGPNSKKTVGFSQTIDWCCNFLGTKFKDLRVDTQELEKRRYIHHIDSVVRSINKANAGVPREQAIRKLSIPGEYFIKRKWSPEVLRQYDVGTPRDPSSPFRERTVVPIYDDTGSFLIGATARSIHEKCQKCRFWHNPSVSCPTGPYANLHFCKWRNTENFHRETCLYNYWYAKGHIKRTQTAVLVEGPGDLWRLVEAEIPMGLAMLGVDLSDQQQVILEMSGAMNVVLLLNNDTAGRDGITNLREQLGRSFRIHTPTLPSNDLGDLSPAEVRKLLNPLLERLCK